MNVPLELEIAASDEADAFEEVLRLIHDPCHPVFESIITPLDYLDSISQRLTNFPTSRPRRAESCSAFLAQRKSDPPHMEPFGDRKSGATAFAEESERRVGIEGAQERVHSLLSIGALPRLSTVIGVVAPRNVEMLEEEEQTRRHLVVQLVTEAGLRDDAAWLRLGNSWRKTGDTLMALQCYRRSLALNGDNVDALLAIAVVLQNAKFSDDAAVAITLAVNSNPGGSATVHSYPIHITCDIASL